MSIYTVDLYHVAYLALIICVFKYVDLLRDQQTGSADFTFFPLHLGLGVARKFVFVLHVIKYGRETILVHSLGGRI